MNARLVTSLCVLYFYQQFFFVKIQAGEICYYRDANSTRSAISCADKCCSNMAASSDTACCSSVPWGSVAIPFFVFTGVCMLAVCLVYCRPLWKTCLCGHKCPCPNRQRVASPRSVPPNVNPIYIVHNDDLPDYETTIKDSTLKDGIPPAYNFVTSHPNDFRIETGVPSAPPQYHSRRSSLASTLPNVPID